MKILITVSGGVVQSVHADDATVEVSVYDEDDLRETQGVTVVDRSSIYLAATAGLTEVGVATVVLDDDAPQLRGGFVNEVIAESDAHLFDGTEVDAISADEPCEFEDAEYFAVFAHRVEGGRECIGDFATEGEAHEYANTVSDAFGWKD